ncbi:hypothetical protein [Deinococcus sedimenti]|uniref:Uncharacterized protein n=1 Tax=Deinococcus sedimenti TaxID=1867090 RepID=A0ABQ2S814_9DEIO|nr:hypothetical protein [Deinococcus sedimenti]GGS06810.1 hypothetical protein GCM10008960_36520 [Deinococcus sedimenti]
MSTDFLINQVFELQENWERYLTPAQALENQRLKDDGWESWLEVQTDSVPITLVFHWGRAEDQAKVESDPVPYPGALGEAFEQVVRRIHAMSRTLQA